MGKEINISITIPNGTPENIKRISSSSGAIVLWWFDKEELRNAQKYNFKEQGNGIYILLEDNLIRPFVYIGQSDNVLKRIESYKKDKTKRFQKVILIQRTNIYKPSFEDSSLHFLEKELINLFNNPDRFFLGNTSKGNNRKSFENNRIESKGFFEEIKLLLEIVGFKFEDKINISKIKEEVKLPEDESEKIIPPTPRRKTRKAPFSFERLNITVGEEVRFIPRPELTFKVASKNEIWFRNEKLRLSTVTRILLEEMGKGNKSGAFQGPLYFEYKGRKLTDLI